METTRTTRFESSSNKNAAKSCRHNDNGHAKDLSQIIYGVHIATGKIGVDIDSKIAIALHDLLSSVERTRTFVNTSSYFKLLLHRWTVRERMHKVSENLKKN